MCTFCEAELTPFVSFSGKRRTLHYNRFTEYCANMVAGDGTADAGEVAWGQGPEASLMRECILVTQRGI
jgi:hypothetical protein